MNENQFSRSEARRALGMVRVESATYSQLKVEINKHRMATVTFFGVIKTVDPRSNSPYPPFARKFTLIMRKQGDRWLIEKHQIGDGKEGQPF
jgi:ketosteroid isomerase-like protein